MPRVRVVGNNLGYEAEEHPANIMAWFSIRMGYPPEEIIYPANHPPTLTTQERKKLRQDFGVTVRVSDHDSPIALAGPLHVE